eukprot:14642253-Alexandrium_andersonii.AAC.1
MLPRVAFAAHAKDWLLARRSPRIARIADSRIAGRSSLLREFATFNPLDHPVRGRIRDIHEQTAQNVP